MTEGLGMFWDEDKNCEFDWGEYNREREEAQRIYDAHERSRLNEIFDRIGWSQHEYE